MHEAISDISSWGGKSFFKCWIDEGLVRYRIFSTGVRVG